MESNRVHRHSLTVRINHWMVAASGLILLFSGFGELPMYRRYNLVKVPGLGWSGDFGLNLIIHYLAAIVFLAVVFFHVVYHVRRREFAAWPKRGDVRESVHIIKAMLTGKEEPPHDKFLAEQRLAYAAIAVTTLLLVVTGLIKTWKNLGSIVLNPALLQAITLIHTFTTMFFLFLVFVHLAAFLLRANWPLLPSMFTGRCCRDYACKRHPLWKPEDK